jgi:hypothetical protein
VLGYVDAVLDGDPRRRAVLARLDVELAAFVAADSRLPPADAPD